jgi:hypothetical protein
MFLTFVDGRPAAAFGIASAPGQRVKAASNAVSASLVLYFDWLIIFDGQ